jgi:hypothetical protein
MTVFYIVTTGQSIEHGEDTIQEQGFAIYHDLILCNGKLTGII